MSDSFDADNEKVLKVMAIFHTLDGEVTSFPGPLQWSTFVRLGGCNLRCWKSTGFCDAPASLDNNYAWPEMSVKQIVQEVERNMPCRKVTITGGEPLVQELGVLALARVLKTRGFVVTLETSGSLELDYKQINRFDCVIADLKCPSTEMSKFAKSGLYHALREQDFIKCVIQDDEDYSWALRYVNYIQPRAKVAMSPRHGFLEPAQLVEWLRRDRRFDIMLNLQLHKYIWPHCVTPPLETLIGIDVAKAIKMEV